MSYSPAQWELQEHYPFSGVNLSGSPKTFNNMLGDSYDYRLILALDENTTEMQLFLRLNGDSGANYSDNYMYGVGATASASAQTSQTEIELCNIGTNGNYRVMCFVEVLGDSSANRSVPISRMQTTGGTSGMILSQQGTWVNAADEVTSIVLHASAANVVTGDMWLMRRPKLGIFNAADWEIVEAYEFSGVDLNANPKTFNNLLGDTDAEYLIEAEMDSLDSGALANVLLTINGDTGANYLDQRTYNNAGSLTASTTSRAFIIAHSGSVGVATGRILLSAKSGVYRSVVEQLGSISSPEQYLIGQWWENSADEITSIQAYNSNVGTTASGKITLYKRSKKQSTLPSTLQLVHREEISGDFSSGHTFKNLQGDSDGIYCLRCLGLDSSADFRIDATINSDTGGNYNNQYLQGTGATASAANNAAETYLRAGNVGTTYPGISELWLYPATGKYRPCVNTYAYESGGAEYMRADATWWLNTADEIDEILVSASAATSMTGTIELYKMKLP